MKFPYGFITLIKKNDEMSSVSKPYPVYIQPTQVTTDSSSGSAGNRQGNWEVAVAHLIVQAEENGK